MHFQYAAYAFEQLNSFRNSDIFYPSVDLDANVISFYYKVMIVSFSVIFQGKKLKKSVKNNFFVKKSKNLLEIEFLEPFSGKKLEKTGFL